jgi:Uma2 family endonuclease
MSQHATIRTVGIDEYLAGELNGSVRHEYTNGQLFAMVGASQAHNTIALNIASMLHRHLSDTPCRAFVSDMKVSIETANAFYYPDVLVTCEPPNPEAHVVTAPLMIVEILSPGTEATDRREKRLAYQRLESLREYVLAAQDAPSVEVYRRNDAFGWEVEIYGQGESISLSSLDVELPIQKVYESVL